MRSFRLESDTPLWRSAFVGLCLIGVGLFYVPSSRAQPLWPCAVPVVTGVLVLLAWAVHGVCRLFGQGGRGRGRAN